jgi:drug/metabolite transporter (DMT)-like permease
MNWGKLVGNAGVQAAIGAAFLFGAGTPLAKALLSSISPWLLAGLLYLGAGLGLTFYRLLIRAPKVQLPRNEGLWFGGAILSGGIIGPSLLMVGLNGMPASGASLLLNAEGIFTALLAWFAFKENFDHRIALGMAAIAAGAVVLSWPGDVEFAGLWPSFAVLGACLSWGIDNNLTRKVSLSDSTWVAAVKGLVSGTTNLTLAFAFGATLPPPLDIAGAMLVGFLSYGVSVALFVMGLRHLGTARTGAYFSIAPFFGAGLSLLLGDVMTWQLLLAGVLMAWGTWLHLTEHHVHEHLHDDLNHDHEHTHDEHHQHPHDSPVEASKKHRHPHRHQPLSHVHDHFPDAHHRHGH